MRGLFDKLEVKNKNTLSKAEKKKYNQVLNNMLDVKAEYKVYSVSPKFKIIKDENNFLFFEYFGKVFPSVREFSKTSFNKVFLDDGAVGPLSRGADVMAPGIIKYLEMSSKFSKDDVLGIEIIGKGIFAVGIALMGYDEMVQKKEGPVIDVLHVKGDSLDEARIY